MKLDVNLDPEQINKAVADAIIRSAIGKELNRAIEDEVKRLSVSYQNPIVPIVRQHIEGAIQSIIREKYLEQIQTVVAGRVTEKFTADLLDKLWEAFVKERMS